MKHLKIMIVFFIFFVVSGCAIYNSDYNTEILSTENVGYIRDGSDEEEIMKAQ